MERERYVAGRAVRGYRGRAEVSLPFAVATRCVTGRILVEIDRERIAHGGVQRSSDCPGAARNQSRGDDGEVLKIIRARIRVFVIVRGNSVRAEVDAQIAR